MSRKLAHIEIIEDLFPIQNADKIEVAKVLGWECIVQKGEFKIGDKVIYIEIDSIMPETPEYEFLKSKKYRIKTIKLKGQISQGLVIPIPSYMNLQNCEIGKDVTDELGITKYFSLDEKREINQYKKLKQIETNRLRKFVKKYFWLRKLFLSKKKEKFPYWVNKADEERIQNIPDVLEKFGNKPVYITEKIDGQSVTYTSKRVPIFNGWLGKILPKRIEFLVCSRNFIVTDKNSDYWKTAKMYKLDELLQLFPYLTIQAEQIGPKIQSNKYNLKTLEIRIFNIIDHEKKYHYTYKQMEQFCKQYNLPMVPLLSYFNSLNNFKDLNELIEYSKGNSLEENNNIREGIVVRCIENGKKLLSFKVINPEFLLKYE